MLLRDVLQNEYAPLRTLKPQAMRQYQLTLTRWSETLGRDPTVDDLQPLVVQAFLSARRTKVSAASVRKDRTHVCCLWSYCAKVRRCRSDGQLLEFPTVAPVRAPTRLPRAYRVADVSALIRTALKIRTPVCGLPGGLYFAAMIRLCWETASRIGAVKQLRWSEVDLEGRSVIFLAETTKTGDRDLRRAISAELAEWLRKLERGPNDLVFPWTRDPTSLWYEFNKICHMAGVQPRGFHALRKSNASYVTAAAGVVEAASVCGHKDSKVTIDHYIDETIAKPKHTALDFLPPLDLSE